MSSSQRPHTDAEILEQENARLRRSVEELSLLNDLAVEIGRAQMLDDVMKAVIGRARKAVRASQGVIKLIDDHDEDQTLKTLVRTRAHMGMDESLSPDNAIVGWMLVHRSPLILNADEPKPAPELPPLDPSIRSLVSVPMIAAGRLIGILTVFNKADDAGFSNEDARLLSIMAAQSAQALQNKRLQEERRRIVDVFGRHTSPEVVKELLRREADLSGVRLQACIMFVDIRGFSTYAEVAEPEAIVSFLNTLFDATIEIVTRHNGIVHQLLGDGFMATFGVPFSHGNDSVNAVRAALEVLDRVDSEAAGGRLPATELGIGLHAGEVVAGLVGSSVHQEYKVTGDAVNVAARIEDLNKQFDSRLLVSESVIRALGQKSFEATPLGEVVLHGRRQPMEIYRLA